MHILIEMPRSLLLETYAVHGANKIVTVMYRLFLDDRACRFTVVTDFSDEECLRFNSDHHEEGRVHYCRYSELHDRLSLDNGMPDIGVVLDFKVQPLLCFRAVHGLSFPVVGLIHSLGFYSHFRILQELSPMMAEQDVLVCPSDNTKSMAIKAGIDRKHLRVLHYGLDITKYQPVLSKSSLRKSLGLPESRSIVLLLSRLSVSVKMDLTPVIRQLPYYIKQQPDLLFYIVGSILDEDYVKELKVLVGHLGIEKYIIWEHEPDHDHIEQYYQASDVFLSLSDVCGETYGLTVMEAMACGLPVIISEFAGYNMHITDGKEGFYVPTLSAQTHMNKDFYMSSVQQFGYVYGQSVATDLRILESSLMQVLQDETFRLQMGQAGRALIESRNTLEHMKQGYMVVFKDCVERAKACPLKVPQLPWENVSSMLMHQVSYELQGDDVFCLTPLAQEALQEGKEIFFFENQLETFKLVRVVLHILSQGETSLDNVCTSIRASDNDIRKNVLFLLKQGLVTHNSKG